MKKLLYILICSTFIIFACKKPSKPNSTIALEDGPDTTAPVITLRGPSNCTMAVEENYTDPGVTAIDDRDGDISSKVIFSAFFTATITGKHEIQYNIEDAAGNKAETKTRTFLIINTADYLAGNYNATCTCNQYTYGMQYSPNIQSTETFTTFIEPSKNKNKFIYIWGIGYEFQVNAQTIGSTYGGSSGTISADGKEITVYTIDGYRSIGSTVKECNYILKK